MEKGEKAKVVTGLEGSDVPVNTFNSKKPFKGKIKSVERIVGPKATGETCHIIIETGGDIPFHEGQSYGVVPPVSHLAVSFGLLHLLAMQNTYQCVNVRAACSAESKLAAQ